MSSKHHLAKLCLGLSDWSSALSGVSSPPVGIQVHYTMSTHKSAGEERYQNRFYFYIRTLSKLENILHINLLKQGDNVWISQIVQNIDKKLFSWVIPTPFCIFIWTHHQSKCSAAQPLTAIRRSSKHHIFQTLVVSTASSVILSESLWRDCTVQFVNPSLNVTCFSFLLFKAWILNSGSYFHVSEMQSWTKA